MCVREEQVGSVTVLTPRGDMDATTLPDFEAHVDRLIAAGARQLVWDLTEVGMLPSTAAGFFIQAGRRLRGAGGRQVLAGLSSRVLGTLRTMGVADLFRVYPDRGSAIAALQAAD